MPGFASWMFNLQIIDLRFPFDTPKYSLLISKQSIEGLSLVNILETLKIDSFLFDYIISDYLEYLFVNLEIVYLATCTKKSRSSAGEICEKVAKLLL